MAVCQTLLALTVFQNFLVNEVAFLHDLLLLSVHRLEFDRFQALTVGTLLGIVLVFDLASWKD